MKPDPLAEPGRRRRAASPPSIARPIRSDRSLRHRTPGQDRAPTHPSPSRYRAPSGRAATAIWRRCALSWRAGRHRGRVRRPGNRHRNIAGRGRGTIRRARPTGRNDGPRFCGRRRADCIDGPGAASRPSRPIDGPADLAAKPQDCVSGGRPDRKACPPRSSASRRRKPRADRGAVDRATSSGVPDRAAGSRPRVRACRQSCAWFPGRR